MVISKCSICGEAITGEGMGRHALITIEKYGDSGMSTQRYYVCNEHEREIRAILDNVVNCAGTD